MADGNEKSNLYVKQTIIKDPNQSVVTARLDENGAMQLYDKDGNLTENTRILTSVIRRNGEGKDREIVWAFSPQGDVQDYFTLSKGEVKFACDTNTDPNDGISINGVECSYSIGVVSRITLFDETHVATTPFFGLCWIWRGKQDIEALSWDIALRSISLPATMHNNKIIMAVDADRKKIDAYNTHNICFKSGRNVPDNFMLVYAWAHCTDTILNMGMKVSDTEAKRILSSTFKKEQVKKGYLPIAVGPDEAWYAFITITKINDNQDQLRISPFYKY